MGESSLPQFFRVTQRLKGPTVGSVAEVVRSELDKLGLRMWIKPGQTVAITSGSRGLSHLVDITRSIAAYFQDLKAQPFLVPAMGSHGGGTAEGQAAVLAGYGITEASVGVPIHATMDTVVLGHTQDGVPVHFDKRAFDADHVFVWNRVKPHTILSGEIQSGLFKMLLLGLGKQNGAKAYHGALLDRSMEALVQEVLPIILSKGKILGGLAMVENGREEVALVEGLLLKDWGVRERALLKQATEWMPRLPFEEIDLLIVDEMGKNISGTGMDPNVIGRKRYHDQAAPEEVPRVKRIYVRRLTSESKGNATGIGLADFCSTQLADSIDWHPTYTNSLTSCYPARAKLPMHFGSDEAVMEAVLKTLGRTSAKEARIVRIKNTLDLSDLDVSEIFYEQCADKRCEDLDITSDLAPVSFDQVGNFKWR